MTLLPPSLPPSLPLSLPASIPPSLPPRPPQRPSPRSVAWLLASCLLLVLAARSLAADSAAKSPVPAPAAPSKDPASEAERLRVSWTAAPNDVSLGARLQDALCAAGRRDEALSLFRKHRAARRDDPAASFLLGRLEGGPAGLKAMWEALDRRLGLAADATAPLAAAWLLLARAEETAGRHAQAADAAAKRADLLGTAESWLHLGTLRERAGDRAAAEAGYRKALAKDPKAGAARDALALVLARSGRHDEARDLAEAGVKESPDAADAYVHLGLVKFLAGDRKGALAAYKKALDRAKDDVDVLQALAATYAELEEFDLAKKALEKARQLAPEDGDRLLQAAAVALQAGNAAEADRLLAAADKALPGNARVAFLQGVAAQRAGRVDVAAAAFERAAEREPQNARFALSLAVAWHEAGKTDKAIDVLEKAVARIPEDYDLHLRLGFLRLEKRKWSKAAEAFEKAASIDPKEPDPHFYAAVVYGDRLKRPDRARDHLLEYKRLGGLEPSALRWLEDLETGTSK